MNNDKHTPGPWRIDPFDGKILGPTIGASSPIVAQMPVWWPHKLPCEHVSQELQASNARLISAAPELLNALELAQATIERLHRHAPGSAQGTLDVIGYAISKATGSSVKFLYEH